MDVVLFAWGVALAGLCACSASVTAIVVWKQHNRQRGSVDLFALATWTGVVSAMSGTGATVLLIASFKEFLKGLSG